MASLFEDPTKLAELARKHWPTRYALLLAEILSLVLTTAILYVIDPDIAIKLIAYSVVCGITYFVWWHSNRLPRTQKGKLGFVISISTGDEDERKKIMEDFVITLQELLVQKF